MEITWFRRTGPRRAKVTRPGVNLLLPILLFHQFLSSITFPIAKVGLVVIEPFTFAFFRYVISSLALFLIVSLQKHERPIERDDIGKLIGLGLIVIPLNQTAYLWGQTLTAAGHGALLFATIPLWIFLLAVWYLKEKPYWLRVVGLVIAIVGVVIVMTSGAIEISTDYLIGDLIIMMAVLAWSFYTVLGKPLVHKYGAFRTTAWALISGSIIYFPFGLYRALTFDYTGVTWTAWISVLYLGLGTSVLAYGLWYWLLERMEVSRLAVYQNMQPIIASAVAYIFLNEPVGWGFIIGGAIVLIGVIITEI